MAEIKVIGAAEARNKIASLMEETYLKGKRFILERRGIPMSVLLGIREYEALLEEMEDVRDMLEALQAPVSEAISYEEYRRQRLARVSGKASK